MVLFRFYLLINMPDATRAIILPQTLINLSTMSLLNSAIPFPGHWSLSSLSIPVIGQHLYWVNWLPNTFTLIPPLSMSHLPDKSTQILTDTDRRPEDSQIKVFVDLLDIELEIIQDPDWEFYKYINQSSTFLACLPNFLVRNVKLSGFKVNKISEKL